MKTDNTSTGMKVIDLEQWKRKEHFEFFHRSDYPQYNICLEIDVTHLVKFTKEKQWSFYYSMIFAATTAINQIENFKYRIQNDRVVLYDTIHPSFTDMDKNSNDDLFKLVTVDQCETIFEFVEAAQKTSENQKEYFALDKLMGRDDLIYITCLPWISFTQISHTISLNKNDSVPRISWGKYRKQGDQILLPFSVQAHHSLVDGFHVGKYINALQEYLNTFQ